MCRAASAKTASIRPPRPSFCRVHWTGFGRCVHRTPPPPRQNISPAAERVDREDHERINYTGPRDHWPDFCGVDSEQIAAKLERKVVQHAGGEKQADVDVVVGEEIPAPEEGHRQSPED